MKSIFFTIILSTFLTGQNEKKIPASSVGPVPADFAIKSPSNGKLLYRKGHIGVGIRYIICVTGVFPAANGNPGSPGPFVGEIRIFAPVQDQVMPAGWMACEGQLLSINPYQMLFALIGTSYGGDGRTNFALPDLRGATVVGPGNGWAITEKSN
jgi:microcystin-dependent protein